MSFLSGTFLDPNIYRAALLPMMQFIGGVLNFPLGLFILTKSRKKPVFVALALMFFFAGIWLAPLTLSEMVRDPKTVLWFGRLTCAGACLLIPSSFFFSMALFNKHKEKAVLIASIYGIGLVFAVWAFTGSLIATNAYFHLQDFYYPKGGTLFPLVGTWMMCVQAGTIYNLIRGYMACTNAFEKEKLKYVAIGYMIAVMGDIDIFPALGFNVFPYGGFPQTIFLWVIAYAIVARKLMDIQTVALKTAVWLATSLVVLIPVCGFLWLAHPWLVTLSQGRLLAVLLVLFIIFGFYWTAFQGRVDQIFQKRLHDLKQVLAEYMSDLAALKDLRQVHSKLNKVLTARLYVESMTLFVAGGEDKYIDLSTETNTPRIVQFSKDNPFLEYLNKYDQIIASEEILGLAREFDAPMQKALGEFVSLGGDFRLIIPLIAKAGLIGWIFLGPRMDGEAYRAVEFEFLDQLRKSLAVAVSNSLLYDQVRQFNASLEATVRSRTAELQQANERLKELDVAKTEFLAMANHELRHPLSAVRGFADMLMLMWDQLQDDRKKELIMVIQDSSAQMLGLISDFLDVSKIELGRFDLNRAQTSLRGLADRVAEQLQVQHKNLKFMVDFSDPDLSLSIDSDKMSQVLINLASNAVKYSPENGVVRFSEKKEDGHVLIAVEDEGPGIPEEHLNKLFHKFYRIETADPNARKGPQVKGSGLGLTIAKSIIEMHGGKIWAENRTDRTGARFCISLPLA